MRFIPSALAIAILCSGCENDPPAPANAASNVAEPIITVEPAIAGLSLPPIDTIELSAPGIHAVVKRDGSGTFLFGAHPAEKFTITPEAFHDLEARLSKYREIVALQARYKKEHPHKDSDPEIVVTSRCGSEENHAGFVSVRWTGKGVDDRHRGNLDCNFGVIGATNRDLMAIVATLPKPRTQEADPR